MSMSSAATGGKPGIQFQLEVVVIAVSDVDRSKRFYGDLGWRLDADIVKGPAFRVVQFTPPGSPCSVQFGVGLTGAAPGSAGLFLVVSDVMAAHAELAERGIDVSGPFHNGSAGRESGLDPERRSYNSFVSFSDPDGNRWLVQEVTARLPGRIEASATSYGSATELASDLRRAAAAHGEHEKRNGQPDANWPDWYAAYMVAEHAGRPLPI